MKINKTIKTVVIFILLISAVPFFASCSGRKEKKLIKELENKPLAPREGLPSPSGDIVLSIAGETITSDQMVTPLVEKVKPIAQQASYEQFQAQLAPQLEMLLTNEVANILLYQKAKKKLGAQADTAIGKAVDAEVQKFIATYNGDSAKAEEQLRSMGMDWQSFREYQQKFIISQSYISTMLPKIKPVTYRELREVYDQVKDEKFTTPASIQFRLIDIQPEKIELGDPNEDRIIATQNLVNDIYTRIQDGEDFGELAKEFSKGHRAIFGGLWQPVNPESLAEPYDIIAKHSGQMKPGQLAEPISTNEHIFIMKLELKTEYNVQSFEEVQQQIESGLKLAQQRQALDKMSQEIAKEVAIPNKERFLNICLQKLYVKASQ
ncbi:MAG: peptidylprolyl isomerase [Planctomycetota bacterium]|jgi:parvulin-like peptidyl-prolyl isomerase